ncbi:DUF58 domain-containing protein [Verrucomicrobiota bacterium]
MKLTDPEFIKRLETLFLLARKVLSGSLKAERKTRKKGSGILFSDYAEYNQGDDFRSIDWKIYGRFEQLMIKLFEVEEDLTVFIMIDMSPSMKSKIEYAKQLAAALGYIALNSLDKIAVYAISDKLEPIFQVCHGRGRIFPFLRALENAACYGKDTRFDECLRMFQSRHSRPGICVLISDFLTPHGYQKGLNLLRWAKNDTYCIQTLDPSELTCDWKGDIEIECIETKNRRKITVSPREASLYAKAIENWNHTFEHECAKREIGMTRSTIDVPFDFVIQNILRRGGLVS